MAIFYDPSVTVKGSISCETAPSSNQHLTRKQDIAGLSYISSIAGGSSSYLSVDGAGALSVQSLLITDVTVDNSATSLAAWISANPTPAGNLKTGDLLILTGATGGSQTWIVSGANGSAAGSYTQVQSPLTAAQVGGVLTPGDGITVNAATAGISANIVAGSGLSRTISSGQMTFALNANSDAISEGSSNLYYTNARARAAVSAGSGLGYNSGTGAFSLTANTDGVSEGSSNLYYTDTRARNAFSGLDGINISGSGQISVDLAAGAGLTKSVNAGVVSFALSANTDAVAEGSSNLYFTNARARAAMSAGAGLAYNSGTGQYSVNANTDGISEGSSNLYFSNARARAAVSAGSGLSYSSGTGAFSADYAAIKNQLRYSAGGVNLSANTAATITHNLGQKLCHVSAMDSAGAAIQVAVAYTNTNSLTVTSGQNINGVDILVSM